MSPELHIDATLVIDAAPPLMAAHLDYFGHLPLQLCRIHASRRPDSEIPKAKRSPEAATALATLVEDRARFEGLGRRDTISALERRFEGYPTHHDLPHMPADTNVAANVIKQLSKKLRLMEGFVSTESAERFSCLLVGCYWFKRFTDSGRATQQQQVAPRPSRTPPHRLAPPPHPNSLNSNTRCDVLVMGVRRLLQIQGGIS